MLKVINMDEHTAETPNTYFTEDTEFKKSTQVQPHDLTDSESFAVDRLVNNPPREEPIPEAKPQEAPQRVI